MNKFLLFMIMLGGNALTGNAQEGIDALAQAIEQFVKAGDEQNVQALEGLLHTNYRIVWNNPEKGTLTVLDRETYLTMIRDKKIGGDQRVIHVESIELIAGGNALVKTRLKGEKANFQSLLSFVKKDEAWLLVQDQVFMQAK